MQDGFGRAIDIGIVTIKAWNKVLDYKKCGIKFNGMVYCLYYL